MKRLNHIGAFKYLFIFFLVAIFSYSLITYFYVPTTKAYKVAMNHVIESKEIETKIGSIEPINFSLFNYRYSYSDLLETTLIRLNVAGIKGKLTANIYLTKKNGGNWTFVEDEIMDFEPVK